MADRIFPHGDDQDQELEMMNRREAAEPVRDAGGAKAAPQGRGAPHSYIALLGLRTFDTAGLLERVREGLSYSSWDRFLQSTGLSKETALLWVSIAPRTLVRRKEEGRLHPDESD